MDGSPFDVFFGSEAVTRRWMAERAWAAADRQHHPSIGSRALGHLTPMRQCDCIECSGFSQFCVALVRQNPGFDSKIERVIRLRYAVCGRLMSHGEAWPFEGLPYVLKQTVEIYFASRINYLPTLRGSSGYLSLANRRTDRRATSRYRRSRAPKRLSPSLAPLSRETANWGRFGKRRTQS